MDDRSAPERRPAGRGCLIVLIVIIVLALLVLGAVVGDGLLDEWESNH